METWGPPGYEVGEMLGFGATGEVWRAVETATGEVVALKRLRAGAGPAGEEALRREAAVLAGLDTPYVVRLRAVVGDVLVLDHAAGGSLAALLSRRGALEPGEAVTVAVPVAQALTAAHAAGLVHGDVSPANVLFTAEGMPLLSDLGLTRAPGGGGPLSGTAEYLDPAVAAGGAPSPASDVWALAAVLHHVLSGSPPHGGSSVDRVLAAAARHERAPLGLLAPRVPRPLVDVVEGALVADPAARPTAAALASALLQAQTPAPVRLVGLPAAAPGPDVRATHAVPRPARPPDPLTARRRVRPAVVLGGAVLAALLTAGLHWALGGGGGDGSTPLAAVAVRPAASAAVPGPATPSAAAPSAAGPSAAGSSAAAPSAAAPASAPGPRQPEPTASVPTASVPTASVPSAPPGAAPLLGPYAPNPRAAATPAAPAGPATAVPTPTPTSTPTSTPRAGRATAPAAPDWAVVLDRLDGLREQAFARGDAALLAQVWAPGSTGGAADTASLAALTAQGQTATGVRHRVRSVDQSSWTGDRAQVRVVDELGPQVVRDGAGGTVRRLAGRAPAPSLVELVRVGGAWRLSAVVAA